MGERTPHLDAQRARRFGRANGIAHARACDSRDSGGRGVQPSRHADDFRRVEASDRIDSPGRRRRAWQPCGNRCRRTSTACPWIWWKPKKGRRMERRCSREWARVCGLRWKVPARRRCELPSELSLTRSTSSGNESAVWSVQEVISRPCAASCTSFREAEFWRGFVKTVC